MKVNLPTVRSVRLASGLTLFAYASCHFLSHATGIFLLDSMETFGRGILLWPWRTWPGGILLAACFFVHGTLGLRALYMRRTLRMPAIEAWQLGLGLLIPLLLIPHAVDIKIGHEYFDVDTSYFHIVTLFWVNQPWSGLPRQLLLLLVVWGHGCLGIYMWIRFRPWYRRWRVVLAAAAILVPVLAFLGITNAGWDAALRMRLDPAFAARHGTQVPGTPGSVNGAILALIWDSLQVAYVALVVVVFAAKSLRDWSARRRGGICVTYPHGRRVMVRRGTSILEASRWGRVPHASACGGRGRCSTCRVRVLQGLGALPAPQPLERATLERVVAPDGVRLACQTRPNADITVLPLVAAGESLRGLRVDLRGGRELDVAAMFIDLRESTALAAQRLPFDVIFIVDRYIQAVTGAVHAHGGIVTSIAGDGIMSVFGVDRSPAQAARDALAAAADAWAAIDELSGALYEDIGGNLQFGIGIHCGLTVVGSVGLPGQPSVQFLGDTGNVAARLEAMTKELSCRLVVSQDTFTTAGYDRPGWVEAEVAIRGRGDALLDVVLAHKRGQLNAFADPRRVRPEVNALPAE